jgi:hypothetical protein
LSERQDGTAKVREALSEADLSPLPQLGHDLFEVILSGGLPHFLSERSDRHCCKIMREAVNS